MSLKRADKYLFEYLLIAVAVVLTVLGFWELYLGPKAAPNSYHHLHLTTDALWLGLLFYQLRNLDRKRFANHRKVGLAVLLMGPLLFATTAMLSVHSAHKGVVSGEGDPLILQNVGVTVELGLLIVAAFAFRKRRKLHASFLLSTTILFIGIALFFTLISFVPQYKIEGPETFYRFAKAGMTGQVTCVILGLFFFLRDFRNGWPFLLAGLCFPLNDLIRSSLDKSGLVTPFTEAVGGMSQPITFVGSFVLLLVLLLATGVARSRRSSVVDVG